MCILVLCLHKGVPHVGSTTGLVVLLGIVGLFNGHFFLKDGVRKPLGFSCTARSHDYSFCM